MLYNVVLVPAIHQHESAIGIHMCPPSYTSLPPPSLSHPSRLSQSTGVELPAPYSKFPLAVCFTHGNAYVSMLFPLLIPPSPFHTVSTSLFHLRLQWCQYHLSRLHIYVLIYNICLSPSDSLHPI